LVAIALPDEHHSAMRRGWHNRGYLSHLDSDALVQHVVFRLADSLPRHIVKTLALLDRPEQRKRVDALLDAGHGAMVLRKPEIATIVRDALKHFDGERYALHAWCVMPNPVHVAFAPIDPHELSTIIWSWKSFTAKAINRALDREGPIWAPDYYDRYVRGDAHYAATLSYIENNPVKAGLCSTPSEWPYSSAFQRQAE
jgi:REP element-mobilizing transposase RayT